MKFGSWSEGYAGLVVAHDNAMSKVALVSIGKPMPQSVVRALTLAERWALSLLASPWLALTM